MALESIQINEKLVQALIADQFPQWMHLPVRPTLQSGWDNRSFLIGESKVARLPSSKDYEVQVHREQRWLPYLRTHLTVEIPEPLALGRPGRGYPWSWSIYRWIEGETAANSSPGDIGQFAGDLAIALSSMHDIPTEGGPESGQDNFHRGGALSVYDEQARLAIATLGDRLDVSGALAVWELGLASHWSQAPVWVHGDIALGNLLLRDGRLAALIDFGQVCVGDPACDLAIAWTYFRGQYRRTFQSHLKIDPATWQRGRAWALWKAAIVAAGIAKTNAPEGRVSLLTIDEVLDDYACTEA